MDRWAALRDLVRLRDLRSCSRNELLRVAAMAATVAPTLVLLLLLGRPALRLLLELDNDLALSSLALADPLNELDALKPGDLKLNDAVVTPLS